MNVTGYSTDTALTAPYPAGKIGVKLRLLKGDVMYPDLTTGHARPGRENETPNWFNWIPIFVTRKAVGYRPFFSLGIYGFGVYVGWKVFGVDSQAYMDYPGILPRDIYPGSLAMCPTIRFTTNRSYA